MNQSNYQLYFKYILFNSNILFLKTLNFNLKNINFFILQKNLYFLTLHLKFSSFFYSTQLSDLTVYETPINFNLLNTKKTTTTLNTNIIVYNFHILLFNQRIFLFILNFKNNNIQKKWKNYSNLNSITELFNNANWLEREMAELHGIFFYNKKDIRNLMLQYGDNSTPLLKHVPSIGFRELYYDSVNDIILQIEPTIQF